MQLDRNALNRLLSMSDTQLKYVITKLAVDNGLDLSTFNISGNDMNSIRNALSNATDQQLELAAEQLRRGKQGGH